ncbi:SDR family NAD(P)-dependent oxidoreductase [Nocardia arthritidis]|uniref:SDR family NAD(P)-dependent oxidoreductase n=1 Tax=Nocardia arthritidis TaxID=228602 RepID=A0A6G9Y8I1_9NOCA|nr:SDR family oxidoreductase [Nocardia arthritidis]QIS09575.1 SDR family NAD(P)-dependent oxidoreductase [Nocardia arthritidis]
MTEFLGKTVVVTGAGSGIGQALARQLAASGARLALSDIDQPGLTETVRQVRALDAQVHGDVIDVGDRNRMFAYANEIRSRFDAVHVVFNNAGTTFTGSVEESDLDDFERVLRVNFWGVVNGTKAFLPHLIASGAGHVVNVSSVFGLVGFPGQSAYTASKFAVRGFTEALRMELREQHRPVKVTCVIPGGVKTGIVRNSTAARDIDVDALVASFDKDPGVSAVSAARTILAGVRAERGRVLIGRDAWLLELAHRLLGPAYQRVVGPIGARWLDEIRTPRQAARVTLREVK